MYLRIFKSFFSHEFILKKLRKETNTLVCMYEVQESVDLCFLLI